MFVGNCNTTIHEFKDEKYPFERTILILIDVGILFVNVKMIDILFFSIIIVIVNGTDNFVTKSVTGRAVINVLDDLFGQLKI